MKVKVFETKEELGKSAAQYGANLINEAISKRGKANIIVATGASQFEIAICAMPSFEVSDIATQKSGFHSTSKVYLHSAIHIILSYT